MHIQNRALALLSILLLSSCSPQSAIFDRDLAARSPELKEKYIVVFNETAVEQVAQVAPREFSRRQVVLRATQNLIHEYSLPESGHIYTHVFSGAVLALDLQQKKKLERDPRVSYIEKDQRVTISSTQSNPPWGLDRIDQTQLPLDNHFEAPHSGAGAHIYVIDTGIQVNHEDFSGRARVGVDEVGGRGANSDCNGHGTHVAATAAGTKFGVAKSAAIIAVRVLDCLGSGQFSDVIAGIDWVTQNHQKPAVANVSLGGPASQAIDDALRASIRAGVTYVVAAGNENGQACNTSPARVPEALTVGSTTRSDVRSSFSNFGTCVDIFAPGSDVLSAWYSSNTATQTISGTSMASPHVSGAAALYLEQNPQATPLEVAQAMAAGAIVGQVSDPGVGSPNRLLNVGFVATQPIDEVKPIAPLLEFGQTLQHLFAAKDGERFYAVRIPTGVLRFTVHMQGGTGDADLYVQSSDKPSLTQFECRPYKWGNDEICEFEKPKAGLWYIGVHAYTKYSGLSLRVEKQ